MSKIDFVVTRLKSIIFVVMKKTTDSYRLLGIDPGTNVLGFAIIEINNKQPSMIDLGIVTMTKYQDHHDKLKEIFESLQQVIKNYKPTVMAIEAPFYGKNVQSMLKLGRAQGVAIAAGMMMGLEITEYAPKKIKQSVTGNGNASKEQVLAMLEQILKVKLKDFSLDATDALAAAVCHHFQSSTVLGKGKRYGDWSSFLKNNPGRVK